MAGRRLRNRSITFLEDSIDGRDSNEVDEVSSLDNTAVNQETETEVTVTSVCEGNNSDSIVATEVSDGMSIRQLQDLLINTTSTLRADIVTIIDNYDVCTASRLGRYEERNAGDTEPVADTKIIAFADDILLLTRAKTVRQRT
jgi:hypothetical protein